MDLGPSRVPGNPPPDPGLPIALTAAQMKSLTQFVAQSSHPYGVAIRDEGDGYVGVYLLDTDGGVIHENLLFPTG